MRVNKSNIEQYDLIIMKVTEIVFVCSRAAKNHQATRQTRADQVT